MRGDGFYRKVLINSFSCFRLRVFLSNFIETTLGSVTKETSQYTKSLRKKIEDVDKKIKFSDTEWEENENIRDKTGTKHRKETMNEWRIFHVIFKIKKVMITYNFDHFPDVISPSHIASKSNLFNTLAGSQNKKAAIFFYKNNQNFPRFNSRLSQLLFYFEPPSAVLSVVCCLLFVVCC